MIAEAEAQLPASVLATFLAFCRIGTCLMVMPGFGTARVPAQIRLYIALGATAALVPLIGLPPGTALPHLMGLIVQEAAIGGVIGLMGRAFMAMFQFLAEAASSALGLSMIAPSVEDGEQLPSFATFLTLSAGVLLFVMDLHLEVLRALAQSYTMVPVGGGFDITRGLSDFARVLSQSSLLALQLASPFLVFAILVNVLFGLLAKLAPQIPSYFISPPFIIAGGLFLLYLSSDEILRLFMAAFESWLKTG